MFYSKRNLVVLVSKDYKLKEIIRQSVYSCSSLSFCHLKSLENINLEIFPQIIFLDSASYSKPPPFECFKVLIVEPSCPKIAIQNYYKRGFDIVIDKPVSKRLVESILCKTQSRLEDKEEPVTQYHGIKINEASYSVCINDCTTYLSPLEFFILKILISKNRPVPLEEIYQNLKKEQRSKMNKDSVRVVLSRLRKKIQKSCGLNVIKNRYAQGYEIAI